MRAHLLGTQLLLAKLHDGRGAHGRGARGGRRTRKLRRRKSLDGAEEGQHERGKHPRRSRHPSECEVSLRFPGMRLNGRGKLRQRTEKSDSLRLTFACAAHLSHACRIALDCEFESSAAPSSSQVHALSSTNEKSSNSAPRSSNPRLLLCRQGEVAAHPSRACAQWTTRRSTPPRCRCRASWRRSIFRT